jgi:hypothetical protein
MLTKEVLGICLHLIPSMIAGGYNILDTQLQFVLAIPYFNRVLQILGSTWSR